MGTHEVDTWVNQIIQAIGAPTVADWVAAGSAALTTLIAVGAALFAWGQVKEARESRQQARDLDRQRSQPYVVVYTEPSSATEIIIDLVVKNYGQTAAHDVSFEIDPWPQRTKESGSGEDSAILPRSIAVLAPGQEWRVMWDHGPDRYKSDLPDRHEGTVTYTGIDGEQLTQPIVLDWTHYKTRRWVEVRGLHDAAKALREINSNIKKWNESPRGALSVYVRSGDKKDEAEREHYEAFRAARQAAQDEVDRGPQSAESGSAD